MIEVLIAFAVVAGVGLFVGALLALLSHFFGLAEDKRIKDLRSMLPGVNCGACGYRGCDDYAAALVEGTAASDRCVPGGADTVALLAEYLGTAAGEMQKNVAVVHCNGCYAPTAEANIYEGVKSCKAAAMLYGGPQACQYACLGFGDCAALCPVNAICMRDGIAHVDASRCIGCGLCVASCPKKVISMVAVKPLVQVLCSSRDKGAVARKKCTNACIGCKKCEKACPHGAISVRDNLAVVDAPKCTGCGLCSEACPTGCLGQTVPQNA